MVGILISTLFTVLTWQFAQFVLLLEGFALFGAWSLDILTKRKVSHLDLGNVNNGISQNIVSCSCCCSEDFHFSIVSLLLYCITAGLYSASSFDPSMVQTKSANDYYEFQQKRVCLFTNVQVIACLFFKSQLTKSNDQELTSHPAKSELA